MRNELLFIDTNVVMDARGKEHPYRASCGRIILEIAAGSFRENFGIPVTDTEVFQEILYRYALVGKWETGISVCRDLFTLGQDIPPIGSGKVKKMIELAEIYKGKGVPPRDLVHTAAMLSHGVEKVVSADAHFDLVEEVVRVDPLDLYQR
ncbi:type II toxin-antitoxin system VapC family toxin [Dehalococcoidia bacterium]|nr:type II toxin-antitoxin system VapC family toxin [Dehalococcoidia bacterium]